MTQEKPQQNTSEKKHDLSNAVLERIKKEHLEPVPRWHFVCSEYAIWGLWGASVLLGAVAVSVMLYVSMHASFAMYEATHDTPISFFVDVLPYIWIAVFLLMFLLAYFNLRKTKKGYRYPLWQIVVSSLLFSLVGGGMLHAGGVGYLIDTQIANDMPMLPSLARTEKDMWQSPQKGRIIGMFTAETQNEKEIVFTDMDDVKWIFNTTELMPRDIKLLESGKRVRVIGMVSTTSDTYFHGCAVFPWMFDAPVVFHDLMEERRDFEEHVERQASRLIDRAKSAHILPKEAENVFDEEEKIDEDMGMCPTLPLIKKLSPPPVFR